MLNFLKMFRKLKLNNQQKAAVGDLKLKIKRLIGICDIRELPRISMNITLEELNVLDSVLSQINSKEI